jgi:hypothetical protein
VARERVPLKFKEIAGFWIAGVPTNQLSLLSILPLNTNAKFRYSVHSAVLNFVRLCLFAFYRLGNGYRKASTGKDFYIQYLCKPRVIPTD